MITKRILCNACNETGMINNEPCLFCNGDKFVYIREPVYLYCKICKRERSDDGMILTSQGNFCAEHDEAELKKNNVSEDIIGHL